MARLLIEGFETGTINTGAGWNTTTLVIESSTVDTGAYAGKADITVSNQVNTFPISFAKTTVYSKARIRVNVASNPSATRTQSIICVNTNTVALIARVQLVVATNGTVTLEVFNNVASTTPISGISFSANTWHLVEFKCTINATTGVLEVKVDGSTTTASSQNTGTNQIQNVRFGSTVASGTGGSGTIFYDNIVVDDAAYPGDSKIIARQPSATTGFNPASYDQWTKSSGTDAFSLWDETPVDATNNCVSDGTNDPSRQYAGCHDFDTTQTGHGTETIGSSDTINAVQLIANALRSGGAGRTFKLGYGATPTLYSVTLGTSATYVKSDIFTETYANLAASTEIGAEKSGGAGGQSMTVNDMWLMVEYTQGAVNATINATGVGAIVGTAQTTISNVTPVTATGVGAITAAPTTTIQASSAISANNPAAVVSAPTNAIQASSSITGTGVGIVVSAPTTSIAIGAAINVSGCSIEIAGAATTLQASSSITASGCSEIIGAAATSPQASSSITSSGCGVVIADATTSIELGASVNASGCGIEISTVSNSIQAGSSIAANGCGAVISSAQTSPEASSSLAVNGCGILIANGSNTLELSTSLSVNECGILISAPTTSITIGSGIVEVNATGCGIIIGVGTNTLRIRDGDVTVNYFQTLRGANTFGRNITVTIFEDTKGATIL